MNRFSHAANARWAKARAEENWQYYDNFIVRPATRKAPVTAPITVITRVEQVEPLYLNKKQLAQSLLVSERTIDSWRERRVIPFLKVRGVIRFNVADVRTALKRREVSEKKL